MRKKFFIALVCAVTLICVVILYGYAKTREAASGQATPAVIEINERMFVTQITDIYINPDEYSGKTIMLEGIFGISRFNDVTYLSVFRNSPGCCGDDGMVGFNVIWEGEYPNNNDWVKAVGVLEIVEANGTMNFRLNLSALTVLPNRGAEFVTQ